jgi:hypothetical protein
MEKHYSVLRIGQYSSQDALSGYLRLGPVCVMVQGRIWRDLLIYKRHTEEYTQVGAFWICIIMQLKTHCSIDWLV